MNLERRGAVEAGLGEAGGGQNTMYDTIGELIKVLYLKSFPQTLCELVCYEFSHYS